jgi:molybdenum cofactor cytidylyltransferase
VIFGRFPLNEAAGTILAHTQRLPDRVLRKGLMLDEPAVAALGEAGYVEIIAARLEPGDVGEDECARRLGEALAAPGLRRSRAATGRVNLIAEVRGLLRVDVEQINRLNAVDEALTIATLPDCTPVGERSMVATIKIIPFAVPDDILKSVEARAEKSGSAIRLHAFRPLRVGLVLTELSGLKESVIEQTIAATSARVAGLTGSMLAPIRCAHAEAAIAASLTSLLGQGAELLLVSGASAVVDRRDVGPAGIVRAGGTIIHFGMPVDPGNLICLGSIGSVPALVLPGCARSPKPNGIDWVLQLLFAGFDVGAREVSRMGVGGLLKEMPGRPLPRARASEATAPAPAASTTGAVAALVLAAGKSSRMAPHNKLLLPDRSGKAMVARVVDNILSSTARPVFVVVGHRSDEVQAALAGRPVRFIEAADYASGLSASLRAGIAALPPEIEAVLVCLGDMPLINGRVLDQLIGAYDADEGRLIVVPVHRGKQGNPILWDRRFFAEMAAVTGDSGARFLLHRHMDQVSEIEIADDAVLRDFDTVESLATLPQRMRPAELPG